MKIPFLFVFIAIRLTAFGEAVSLDSIPPQTFSKPFLAYSQQYDDLIVFYASSNYYPKGKHYRVIGRRKKEWCLIDYYRSSLDSKSDSIIKKKISNIEAAKQITALSLLSSLLSEKDITSPCRQIVTKDSVSEIIDFNLNSDMSAYVIEYKIGNTKRYVYQLEPYTAMSICPNVNERKKFKDIIEVITTLK